MFESGSNIEFAHKIHEDVHHQVIPSNHREQWIEITESLVLAMVAIATAWSGYQASKWDARSAEFYNLASRTTVVSGEKATLAGQDHLYDITTFNGWLTAKTDGNDKLAAFYERRFRPEYARAFAVWEKMDPLNNQSAPASPILMAEYANSNDQESTRLAKEANDYFKNGVSARETSDRYVKVTVLLATVLLLIALSQRFESLWPRLVVVATAFVLLFTSAYWILHLPRA